MSRRALRQSFTLIHSPRLLLFQCAIVLALHMSWVGSADADALIVTQAMRAPTIAEYFVEDDRVRLELEIALSEIESFRNLLPDTIYEELGYSARPLASRLEQFFTQDLVLRADEGDPLIGRIRAIGPRPRVRRDKISGEPLPPAADEEVESVIDVTIEYPFDRRPDSLNIQGPAIDPPPSIGFVVYHRSIAVNDFRYLGRSQTLHLNWDDPWYSQFERRSLRRTYFAPMSGFLYVDAFEVRKEIILRPFDLQRWVDLGIEGRETIPVGMQDEVLRRIAEFLRMHHPVTIDGQSITPELVRVNFLERTLRTSRVIESPRDLDVYAAIVGVILSYSTEGLPQDVQMTWDLFDDRIQIVPAASVDQAGSLPTTLEPDFALLHWQNFLQNPDLPTLLDIRRPPNPIERLLAMAKWPFLVLGLGAAVGLAIRARRRADPRVGPRLLIVVIASAGVAAFLFAGRTALSPEATTEIVEGVLHNIYRAFDHRQDDRVYDQLNRSVEGPLLEQSYLETRRGLEVASQGGARARVKEIEMISVSSRPVRSDAFEARASWKVFGSVGHWGHNHARGNRYDANLEFVPDGGTWKLSRMEILEEERL